MKALKKYLLIVFLVLSLSCNALLCYYLFKHEEPSPSIVKFTLSEQGSVIYCEKFDNVKAVGIDMNKKSYTIGNAKLISVFDALYLVTPEDKIKLSDYEGSGFVINSNGELLYSLNTPCKKQETVYITPSGKKYHTDPYCAGKTGFEITLETAKILREPCKLCA